MATSKVKYLGGLRTEATHLSSGQVVITDAPIDNNGKGEAFSPTDLASTSLAACMITIMGIYAENHHINIKGTEATITKVMKASPRMIQKIEIDLVIHTDVEPEQRHKKAFEHIAETCPVALSLGKDTEQDVRVSYFVNV